MADRLKMLNRRKQRKYPLVRSIRRSDHKATLRAVPSLSVWFLTGTDIVGDSHMGHLRPAFAGIESKRKDIASNLANYGRHPLASIISGFPRLTDIQVAVTEAIQKGGNACSTEDIIDHVTNRWQNVRRKDGIPYHTKIRAVVENTLKGQGQEFRLFKPAPYMGSGWSLCTTEERLGRNDESDGEQDLPARGPFTDITELQALIIESIREQGGIGHVDSVCEHVGKTWGNLRKRDGTRYAPDCRRSVMSSLTNSSNSNPIFRRDAEDSSLWHITDHARELLRRTEAAIQWGEPTEAELRALGSVRERSIGHAVLRQNMLMVGTAQTTRNGATNGPNGVAASPNGQAPVARAPSSRRHANGFLKKDDDNADGAFGSDASDNNEGDDSDEEMAGDADAGADEGEGTGESTDESVASKLGLTALQVLIIKAIYEYEPEDPSATPPYAVPFESILAKIQPVWGSLRRRDGTVYATDCRRACQASLSNNPAVPIFKRDAKVRTSWLLGKGGLYRLEVLKKHWQSQAPKDGHVNGEATADVKAAAEVNGDGDDPVVHAQRSATGAQEFETKHVNGKSWLGANGHAKPAGNGYSAKRSRSTSPSADGEMDMSGSPGSRAAYLRSDSQDVRVPSADDDDERDAVMEESVGTKRKRRAEDDGLYEEGMEGEGNFKERRRQRARKEMRDFV